MLVLRVPAASTPTYLDFALSPDASMLAYATRTGISAVSLATRTTVSWPASGGTAGELSWAADDHTLALSWFPSGPANGQQGVRVLDTTNHGTVLQVSRLVIRGRILTVCGGADPQGYTLITGGYPLITGDGSAILASYIDPDPYVRGPCTGPRLEVGEFSVRTGKLLEKVSPGPSRGYIKPPKPDFEPGGWCQVLWTDSSGSRVASTCSPYPDGALSLYVFDNGKIAASSLSVPLDLTAQPSLTGTFAGLASAGPGVAW